MSYAWVMVTQTNSKTQCIGTPFASPSRACSIGYLGVSGRYWVITGIVLGVCLSIYGVSGVSRPLSISPARKSPASQPGHEEPANLPLASPTNLASLGSIVSKSYGPIFFSASARGPSSATTFEVDELRLIACFDRLLLHPVELGYRQAEIGIERPRFHCVVIHVSPGRDARPDAGGFLSEGDGFSVAMRLRHSAARSSRRQGI